ncbi:NUDIX domain-containing protein [Rhizobium sp. B230/85]|nr:NUDIX domain-containing protein [Rhizobium sp. L58/93]MBO9131845.1 NUDIX domain-containing protein [Rhizobium sp. B209b/85]MBO9169613.1 NUDIX domain-containing protein [Rhizobium sp. L245/93]MBO9185562.1 NUDIX domain-containing protein [Rhizobium sp. E27B/91]QXZ85690.1 NUDIX domain-containing protein [Rhizobium sp. K1/93]QXZ90170.1 NUDIX domain-containing protein [Rhizobium sp. K15/93]QXZ95589.1 NUDIX domain-containing protein [Rhizobium sp. B230/85]QYA02710.1 NUDIX domain-containing prot
MSTSHPMTPISVKAIGLVWHQGRLLAAEVPDGQGRVAGVRPLGGSIEFGELSEVALKREFLEELGVEIEIVGGPQVFENLYTFGGVPGHEVIFVFEVKFPLKESMTGDHIVFHESDGTPNVARWYHPDELDRDGYPELYPKGLKSALAKLKLADPN